MNAAPGAISSHVSRLHSSFISRQQRVTSQLYNSSTIYQYYATYGACRGA
ncbi:hypothetical protein [Ktedonospora formicarum]|nr:hypothetical protein [Ktedonospora formicarum]